MAMVISLHLVIVYFVHLTLKMTLSADPDHCPGQRIKCYSCNSVEDNNCNDPFFRQPQQTRSFSLVDCNDYCFKWAFQGPDGQKHLIRNCSTSLNMKMEKYLVCIAESRSSIGYLCFCNKDKSYELIGLQDLSKYPTPNLKHRSPPFLMIHLFILWP
ncbi:unnamed protein product [Schistosoma turkestanicum]|nr:unnamed protein product [Schistosoma turkestanicum]